MSMVTFTSRLSEQQLLEFFRPYSDKRLISCEKELVQSGNFYKVIIQVHKGMAYHAMVSDEWNYNFWQPSTTVWDWKVYLREVFGEEYFQHTGYQDIPNPFVARLSLKECYDIYMYDKRKKIVNYTGNEPVYYQATMKEVKPFIRGTRRFKITDNAPYQLKEAANDYVIFPVMFFSQEDFDGNSSEGYFLQKMLQKFGKEYEAFYLEQIQRQLEDEIETYTKNKLNRFRIVQSYISTLKNV